MESNKDIIPNEPSSPRTTTTNKKDKSKYQAFKSDDDDSSDADEGESYSKTRLKTKKDKSNATSFKVKIINIGKKKEKEKKRKGKKSISEETSIDVVEQPLHEPIFGVPLEKAVERSGYSDKVELPRVMRECLMYIEEKGLDSEGLYRIPGAKSKVDFLKQQYNEGRAVNLDDYDAYVVGGLLKLYLRELPSNILTSRLAPIFDDCIMKEDPHEQLQRYQQLIHDLPCPNRTLLGWLFTHFAHVLEQSSFNKMNIQNLSICFSPTMSISHGVMNLLFQFTKDLFPNVQLVKYIPPEEEDEGASQAETIESLENLLLENEEILTKLHGRVNQEGANDEELMDDLWERQRKSTQLKRKIKEIKKLEKLKSIEKLEEKETIDSEQKTEEFIDNSASNKSPVKKAPSSPLNKQSNKSPISKQAPNISTKPNNKEKNVPVIKQLTPIVSKGSTNDIPNIDPPRKKVEKHSMKKSKELWKAEIVAPKSTSSEKSIEHVNEDTGNQNQTGAVVDADEADDCHRTGIDIVKVNEEDETEMILAKDDEELKMLILEEQRLLIENEEIEKINQYLQRRLHSEQEQLEFLKKNMKHSVNSSSSSINSSSSSRSSVGYLDENEVDGNVDSEKDIFDLEKTLRELEAENERLELRSEELIDQITKERQMCIRLKTDVKMRAFELAVNS